MTNWLLIQLTLDTSNETLKILIIFIANSCVSGTFLSLLIACSNELLKKTLCRTVASLILQRVATVHTVPMTKHILSPVTGYFLIWKSLHLNR